MMIHNQRNNNHNIFVTIIDLAKLQQQHIKLDINSLDAFQL